ncbi:MAG: hypothetical protein ABIL76_05155 [candidate division WOR-3 bacterium]
MKDKEYLIKEFEDLLNLLRERPDYLEKLRILILTNELLELPIKFEEFRNEVNKRFDVLEKGQEEIKLRQQRIEERQQRMEEIQQRIEERQERMEERQQRMEERQQRMEERQQRMEERQDNMEIRLNNVSGWQLEHKVRINICAYVGKYIKKCKIKDKGKMADELDEYVESNIISESERDDVLLLDILVSGISKRTKEEVYIAIEVSYKIGEYDIERVIKRKEILERVYKKEVIPLLIGKEISDEMRNKLKNLNIDFILVND